MSALRRTILALALIAGITPAIAQQFPTVPDRTVIGRIGVGGSSGPSQAIPFSLLLSNLGTTQSANTVWAGPTSGAANVPAFRALVGADLPFPGASSLGGVQSLTCSTSNWFRTLSTGGVFGCSQPAVSDISGFGTGVATALGNTTNAAGGFVTFSGALGTPTSGVGTNLTGTAAGLTAGNVTTNANLTGPVTSVGNATSIGANQVTRANEAQGVARSVVGVTGNATANVADIQGAAGQILAVPTAGTSLAFVGPGQTPGDPSTGSASAGNVGEFISSTVLVGSQVVMTTNAAINITSISLTAGDWDVSSMVYFNPGASTSITQMVTSHSTTTGALDTATSGSSGFITMAASVPASIISLGITPQRISLSGTTTIFLVARSTFTVSSQAAYGIIRARRVR